MTPYEVRPQTEGSYDLVPTRINVDVRAERDPITGSDIVSFNIDDRSPQGSFVYLDLPASEKGSKLTYYGGFLRYRLRVEQHWRDLPPMPDIILKGNGFILIHTSDVTPEPSTPTDLKVRFWPGQWFKIFQDGDPRPSGAEYDDGDDSIRELATREDILIALSNIENILIRVQYHGDDKLYASLSNIIIDTAISPSALAPFKPQAIYVEQCQCPRGYNGLSCQDCAPGFGRDQGNRCVSVTEDTCRPGYYGIPSIGIPCQICPCAQVRSGVTPDCFMESDFQVTCSCPQGYQGGRCEQCSSGYVRQRDECVPAVEETCPRGYYGDPGRGLECRACPCSRTPEGYIPECSLGINYQVYCQCPTGYSGQRCEECASGYVTYAPGTPCVPDLQCNYPVGSLSPRPNVATGRCQCKINYYGDLCYEPIPYAPTCQEDEFLSKERGSPQCVSCFCMGVPTNGRPTPCRASNLIRDKEVAIFTDDTLGFAITDLLSEIEVNDLSVDPRKFELYFNDIDQLTADKKFFWKLPAQFIGNKLGSYGGYLTFTLSQIRVVSLAQKLYHVIIRGNGIQLDHYANYTESDDGRFGFKVFIHESNWNRDDGQISDREHLLMALADLSHILIEALEDSREVSRVAIKDVSLTVSHEGAVGTEVATSVEDCACPAGNILKF